jgi:hypothetical protein
MWLLWILAGGILCWTCVVLFSLWTTSILRRQYGYSWAQVKAHVCVRTALFRQKRWHPAMAPHLVAFIRGLSEEDVAHAAAGLADALYIARFQTFLQIMESGRTD